MEYWEYVSILTKISTIHWNHTKILPYLFTYFNLKNIEKVFTFTYCKCCMETVSIYWGMQLYFLSKKKKQYTLKHMKSVNIHWVQQFYFCIKNNDFFHKKQLWNKKLWLSFMKFSLTFVIFLPSVRMLSNSICFSLTWDMKVL